MEFLEKGWGIGVGEGRRWGWAAEHNGKFLKRKKKEPYASSLLFLTSQGCSCLIMWFRAKTHTTRIPPPASL